MSKKYQIMRDMFHSYTRTETYNKEDMYRRLASGRYKCIYIIDSFDAFLRLRDIDEHSKFDLIYRVHE